MVVGASKEKRDPDVAPLRLAFARAAGAAAIRRGHSLVGGCRTTLDQAAAEGAAAAARAAGLDPRDVIRSWISRSTTPIHEIGDVIRSELVDWYRIPHGLAFPEAIRNCDAVILVGGGDGTMAAATWARFAGKPLLPVAALGHAAEEIFRTEMTRFEKEYSSRVSVQDYQTLNRYLRTDDEGEVEALAHAVVALADDPQLADAYDTYQQTCEAHGLSAQRVSENTSEGKRLVPEVTGAIRRAAFIIADVSVQSPNVFYELGYAHALGKRVIVTAKSGTVLPFDIFDVPTIFWSSQKELREELSLQIRGPRR